MDMQILAKAKVLGTPIDAGFMKTTVGTTTTSTMIVYGKPDPLDPTPGMTLNELIKSCKDIGASFGGDDAKDNITKQLPDNITKKKGALDKIRFTLKEVFFVKKSTDNTTAGTTTDTTADTTAAGTSEYAFWFEINAEDLTKGWPIEIDSVSIKIWATTNRKILEEMKISQMQKLLEEADKASTSKETKQP